MAERDKMPDEDSRPQFIESVSVYELDTPGPDHSRFPAVFEGDGHKGLFEALRCITERPMYRYLVTLQMSDGQEIDLYPTQNYWGSQKTSDKASSEVPYEFVLSPWKMRQGNPQD